MNQEKVIELLEKFANKNLGREEEEMLRDWIESANNKDIAAVMERYEGIVMNAAPGEADPLLFQRIKEKIAQADLEETQIPVYKTGSLNVRNLFPWKRVAAAILIITAGAGSYVLLTRHSKQIAKTETRQQFKNDIAPGGNKAILTLSNGTQIVLDSAANGTLTQQGNTKIIKLDSGQLAYQTQSGSHPELVEGYNTISTPKGGQYQILLADGSKVWLNAASSLKYPAAFSGKERNVELTGEGYFEVAHNSTMPFHVKVNDMAVEVLGTHFNINAYSDEAIIKTTLLQGSVKVIKGTLAKILTPREQAQLNHNNEIKIVKNADIDEAVAWKSGLFQFNHADLSTVMRQLSRWYDVDVSYEGNIPTQQFGGKMGRNLNLSEILLGLQKSDVHYRIEGRKLIVTP